MLAETAAEATSAAEEASRAAATADSDNAAELYHKAQQMLAASSRLQQAIQRAADNTDSVEATAALLCTAAADASANAQTENTETEEGTSGRADTGSPSNNGAANSWSALLYNVEALQLWLLRCCQASKGGMRDKPGKPPDYYHTCYCLSGLSSSQNYGGFVLGPPSNKLVKADPLCNVVEHRLAEALAYTQTNPEYL